jgi:hypothetical protein
MIKEEMLRIKGYLIVRRNATFLAGQKIILRRLKQA